MRKVYFGLVVAIHIPFVAVGMAWQVVVVGVDIGRKYAASIMVKTL